MSDRFATCERCGATLEPGGQAAGPLVSCPKCGVTLAQAPYAGASPTSTVAPASAVPGLQLRPIEGRAEPPLATSAAAAGPALQVRPLASPEPAPVASRSASDLAADEPLEVLDPEGWAARQARRVPLNPHYETRVARAAARFFRQTRDRLYLLSLAFLVLTLVAVLFHLKPLLHLATIGVVASNALMLVDGLLYLMVVPFRESFATGVGATLFPPYHWIKHWDQMRHPFLSTVRSFVPVLLAALIWLGYEERAVLESGLGRVERAIGLEPAPALPGQPQRPNILDDATKVLGGESNLIQQLAQPQQ